MADCIFCKIIKGEIPCYKVYEDDDFLAFLDINPLSRGHTLLIPKEHYKDIFEMPDELLAKVAPVIKKIIKALDSSGIGEGYNILQTNRKAADQDVFHIHFHILPRIEGDKALDYKHIEKPSEQEMLEIANKIKNSL